MLDRNSPIPLVYQVQNFICNQILSGVYNVGDLIPGQESLADILNVSRITIKNAFMRLVDLGILDTHKGKGTFIKKIPEVKTIKNNIIIDRGRFDLYKCEMLSVEIDESYSGCKLLGSTKTICIVSKRIIGDYVLGIEKIWLPSHIDVSNISSSDLGQADSIQNHFYKKLGLVVKYYEETLEPRFTDDDTCYKMSLNNHNTLLCVKRKTYSFDNSEPFEYREVLMRYEDYGKIIVMPDRVVK